MKNVLSQFKKKWFFKDPPWY